jgi:Ran GTPase-activating protein (RanGAP) involved in mRNA processing and transport
MRLFLHGRSDPSATVQRIRSHIDQQQQQQQPQNENDSLSSIASASDEGAILLSGFDLDLHSDVCEALVDLFSSTSTWSEIKLQNCQGKEGLSLVLSAILQTASVSQLILLHTNHQQSNRLSCPAAQALGHGLAQSSCRVQSLTLKGLCLPEASMTKIARALGQPSCTLLELAMKGSFTTKEMDHGAACLEKGAVTCLVQALKRNTNLQVLDLEGANLSDTSLSLLVMALANHPNLSTLSLRGNAAARKTIQALAYILSQQRKLEGTLTKLDLSAQRSSVEAHDDEEQEDVPQLEWEPLFLALQSNPPTLQHLIMSDNHLNSHDTFDLAMALCVNTHLTELQLSNCCISDRGLVALADNLSGFTGLMKLRIDGEQHTFGKKSVKRLVRNLAYNFQLESLELPVGLGKSRTMQLYLNLNRAGRKYLIPQGQDNEEEEDDDVYDTEDEEEKDDSHHGEATNVKTTRTGTPHCALWPKILQRADTIARRHAESAQKGDEASADVLYHLLCSGFLFHS